MRDHGLGGDKAHAPSWNYVPVQGFQQTAKGDQNTFLLPWGFCANRNLHQAAIALPTHSQTQIGLKVLGEFSATLKVAPSSASDE